MEIPNVPPEKKKIGLVIAGIAVILVLFLMTRRSSGESPGPTVFPGYEGGMAMSGLNSTLEGITDALTELQNKATSKVNFKFAVDNSQGLEYQSTSGSGKSGGGALNVFGLFSIGGSGRSQSQGSTAYKSNIDKTFVSDVSYEGSDQGVIQSIMDWLTGLVGTASQQAQNNLSWQAGNYPFVDKGKKHPGFGVNVPLEPIIPTNPDNGTTGTPPRHNIF